MTENPTTTSLKTEAADQAVLQDFELMAKAGMIYGRKKSKTNPKMARYIFGIRNGVQIIDIAQTAHLIKKAGEFLQTALKDGGSVMLVGTRPASKDIVKAFGLKFGLPYVEERWLGGTLTNFEAISKRLNYYLGLKQDSASGRLEKYTKKERILLEKKIEKLTKFFSGLEKFTEKPKALLVVNPVYHITAVREANRLNIPVVALMNTDADPDRVVFPIPVNDNSKASIQMVFDRLETFVAAGIRERAARPVMANLTKPSGGAVGMAGGLKL